MKRIILAALLLCLAVPVHAADLGDVVSVWGGVNGAWFDGPDTAFPADLEVGGNAAASLSPHLSAVGAVYYGFDHSYVRWSAGGRVTVTDVDNKDFSVGLGLQYRGASEAELQPNEWAYDASFGVKPFAAKWPKLSVVGQGWYGIESQRAGAILGLRYMLPI